MNAQFEISQLKATIESLIAAYPELAEDEILRADMINGETDILGVVSELIEKTANASAMQEALAIRQKEISARKSRFATQEEALRRLVSQIMETANLKSLKLPEATLSMTYRQPRLIVTDETLLDEQFKIIVTTLKPNMDALKEEHAKSGITPRGTTLTNGSSTLTIRKS